ncbi:uncharacterized protein N0V89_007553 [Didymosphaeria variabile]|uniref:Major facilitator superfamily (MFS) profile domain-containing protein n=1 Tax=Didymosphaeria variabile TaxID=1932322 RepID=A0A9W8XL34_9PLEO|nr:uncharacterized protein N0V89_007553 [Didymosphaeria variabile]KAJ4352206.1 hypothetical protein N0V89_007553 [Didymosphaeria variabile]
MSESIDKFINVSSLEDYDKYIRRGAFLAQSKAAFPMGRERRDGLTLRDEERYYLQLEDSSRRIDKFKQPWRLYALVGVCSLGAAVQGWDETAVNGAQVYYREALGLMDSPGWLGLVNSAPYMCCAFSCWLNYPLNRLLDRRGVIFVTCLISSLTCLGQAFPQTWQQLFAARFLLGLGIGPKSATIPIYAAEAAPANIRGALVMMWQMWTAFGIMCGRLWNHIPLFVVAYVYTLPESPRWLLMRARQGNRKKYEEAFNSLCKLRHTKLQAGRDIFLINHLLEAEERIMQQEKPFSELFTRGRNRRALTASVITMFLQQFCGVNVTAYYSSTILADPQHASYQPRDALLISMGFGIINFLFAIPAIWTIDSFGRRNLLLSTFPFMALFQIIMVIAFKLPGQSSAQHVLVILGMYLFGVAYSPGEGPVPFVYSAESMPLYNRDFGMGIVTSVNWFWNFFISITWPKFSSAFGTSGAFGWYAAWCVVGFFMILFLVPETKDMTLEELDQVFDHHTMDYVKYGMAELHWMVGRYVFGRKGLKKPPPFLQKKDPEEVYDTRGEAFDPRGMVYEEIQEDKRATT